MHLFGCFGSDTTVFKQRIKSGNEQRVYMFFDGVLDIIDGTRIAIDNGFTMHEAFSTQEDYTPGNVCSSSFEATLLNYDGALSSFNFKRNFALLLGVSYGSGHNTLNTPPSATLPIKACIVCSSITFELDSDGHLWYKGSNDENWVKLTKGALYDYSDVTAQGIFAVSTASTKHEVYAVDDQKKIWRITVDGNEGYVFDDVTERGSFTPSGGLSDLAYARLVDSTSRRTAERWYLSANNAWLYETVVDVDGSGYTTNNIMFSSVNCFDGEKPKKVFGKTITFKAQDWNARLDVDAADYIATVYTSARSIVTIADNLYGPFGMSTSFTRYSNWTSLIGVTYEKNPFAGLSGYTYRDLAALIAESVGCNVRFEKLTFTFTRESLSISSVPTPYFNSVYGTGLTLDQDEIYDYDLEEQEVRSITQIIVRQTEKDVGVAYPASASNPNVWNIIDNPLFTQYTTTEAMQTRIGYAYERVSGRSGGFRPGTVDMFSQLVLQPGDRIAILDEDGSENSFLISQMTTTWNGMADCVIECLGRYERGEDSSNGYKEKLRSGRKYHDFIVDVEQLYSEIGDLSGNVSLLQQNVGLIETRVEAQASSQIFRGTNKLDTLNAKGTADNHWENEKWVRNGAAAQFEIITLTDSPVEGLSKAIQITATNSEVAIYQDKIPLAKTYGVTDKYTVSYWYRIVNGTPSSNNVIERAKTSDSVSQELTRTADATVWTHVYTTWTCDTNNGEFCIGLVANANCTIQICGMKLEMGEDATPWGEANVFTLTQIQQTANSISTEIRDALGNYYTKTETGNLVSTEIGNALEDYSTTTQTSDLISAYVRDHAYETVSGISITSDGVDVTGSKYIKLEAASDTKTELSYFGTKIYNAGYGLQIGRRGSDDGWYVPSSDIDGWIYPYTNALRLLAKYDHNGSSDYTGFEIKADWVAAYFTKAPSTGACYLGTQSKYWDYGYIDTLNYYNLVQQSSIHAKHNIKPLPDVGEVIDRLEPVSYVYNRDDKERTRYGLIHEHTIDVLPDICVGYKDDDTINKSINYIDLIAILLKEVQSLRARVKALEGGQDHD